MRSNQVLPFYVVCDVSYSMMDHIDAVNDSLRDLQRAIGADQAVSEMIRFCLIGFSESAEVLVPLGRPSEIGELSGLTVRAASNFGAVFTFLRDQIARDVERLMARSCRVCRPAVFFLSDGQPTDPSTWSSGFAALTDAAWIARPNVIAFGIGDADPVTIARIGTFRAFFGQDGMSPSAALRVVTRLLATSTSELSTDTA
jgi:uncharacterized protein YegL